MLSFLSVVGRYYKDFSTVPYFIHFCSSFTKIDVSQLFLEKAFHLLYIQLLHFVIVITMICISTQVVKRF